MNLKNDIIQELAKRLPVIIVEDGYYTEPKADFYKGNVDSNNSKFVKAKQNIMSSFNNALVGEEKESWSAAVEDCDDISKLIENQADVLINRMKKNDIKKISDIKEVHWNDEVKKIITGNEDKLVIVTPPSSGACYQ